MPVALKLQSPDIAHKTEAGALRLNLRGEDEVRTGFAAVLAAAKAYAPAARILGVLVQAMAAPGQEVILGIKRDPTFGPMLLVGLGGLNVELLNDVVLTPLPLRKEEALSLLWRLRGARLLRSFRGGPPTDVDALVDAMLRLARLAQDCAEVIAEIDLNPIIVHRQGQGISVVDALVVKAANRA
jgi:acetyltransferase